jgi:hypothetical protein
MAHTGIHDAQVSTDSIAAAAGAQNVITFPGISSTNHLIIVYATALGDTSGNSCAWITAAQFVVDGVGTMTRPFPVINIYRQRQDPVWAVDLITDGTDAFVELTADATESSEWMTFAFCFLNNS